MPGPLTAADDFNIEDYSVNANGVDSVDDLNVDQTPYGVDISNGVADLSPVYDAAIQRLKAERGGLSNRERLGALLIGFGQPTRHGRWQEGVSNAANVLFQQTLAQKTSDEKRRSELERLMNARDIAGVRSAATIKAAEIRAAASGATKGSIAALGHKPNADEIKRMGIIQNRRPNYTPEQVVKEMYEPWVENLLLQPDLAKAAITGGYPEDAAKYTPPAGATIKDLRDQAAEALRQGAPRDKVIERLRGLGISTEGL